MTKDPDSGCPARTRLAQAVEGGKPAGHSHRLHRLRGGFCGRGYCQQCQLPDGALACEADAGTDSALRRDLLRPLGFFGQRMEPWFYETRFLRPRFARQLMLEVLRRLSAAGPLPKEPASIVVSSRELETDLLVVGGGPAGIAAAAAAARRVPTLLLTRTVAGGSLPLDERTRARVADDLAACRSAGASIVEGTLCIGRYGAEERFVAVSRDGPLAIRASRCVIATGAYDRPLLLPGADLPGVVGLRGFQVLASQGAFRRRAIGAVGGVEELRRVRATAEAFDLRVAWTVGPDDAGGDGATAAQPVRKIAGRRRVRGIDLADGRSLASDVVVIATTQPTYELQIHLGATPRFEGTPPVIRAGTPAGFPSLVVGEAAGWSNPDGAGERAAAATTAWLDGMPPNTYASSASHGVKTVPSPHAVVCVCEDVHRLHLDRAIDEGFGDVELVKRRSGASTGACQGKLCLALIAESFMQRGLTPSLPAVRPPIRPVWIASLGGGDP